MQDLTPTLEALTATRQKARFKLLVEGLMADDFGIAHENFQELLAMGAMVGFHMVCDFVAYDYRVNRYVAADNEALREYVGI